MRLQGRHAGISTKTADHIVYRGYITGQKRGAKVTDAVRGHHCLGKPQHQAVSGTDDTPGQPQKQRDITRTTAEKYTRAGIRKQADGAFRHREAGFFGDDHMRAALQQPGAAAHDNAIGKRDDRLRKFINGEMRAVFGTEMDRHPVKVAARGDGVEIADIAAGAECARLRAGKNDMRHAIVGCPGRQRLPQRHGHISGISGNAGIRNTDDTQLPRKTA